MLERKLIPGAGTGAVSYTLPRRMPKSKAEYARQLGRKKPLFRQGGFWQSLWILAMMGSCALGAYNRRENSGLIRPDIAAESMVDSEVMPAQAQETTPSYKVIDLQKKVDENLNRLKQSHNRRSVKADCGRLSEFDDFIRQGAQIYAHGITELYALFAVESNGKLRNSSPASADGLAQFTEPTGRSTGLVIDASIDERCHPKAVIAGANYYRQLKDKYKNDILALIAYNRGETQVNRMLRSFWYSKGRTNEELRNMTLESFPLDIWERLPEETKNYIIRKYSRRALLDEPDFSFIGKKLWSEKIDKAHVHEIKRGEYLHGIARKYNVPLSEVKHLNPQIRDWDKVNPGYTIYVPRR